MSLSFWIVDSQGRKGSAVIARSGKANASARGAADGCVPRNVNIIVIWALRVLIGRDHRFIIEVVRAAFVAKEGNRRIGLAAVRRARNGHLGSVNAGAV